MMTTLCNPEISLTAWQKKQAAMLYQFASLEYLKGLHQMVSTLIDGVLDPMVELSKNQNRDSVLCDTRWGTRNTTQNWTNNAWPFLKDLQSSLAKDIATRAVGRYSPTGTSGCFRGMSEYSMQWATVEEEEEFNAAERLISAYAINIDLTLDTLFNRWSDSELSMTFPNFAREHTEIPKFCIRNNLLGESGEIPPRTGVYVSLDDPNAALQFAWTECGGGKLRDAITFNEIGIAALREVGRKDLWIDHEKMFQFAMKSPQREIFRTGIYILGTEYRRLAPGAVADEAFTTRSSKWVFVELLNNEFEKIADLEIEGLPQELGKRIPGGAACEIPGYYFTPAGSGIRRQFTKGEVMPELTSQYGMTFWQWDPRQG